MRHLAVLPLIVGSSCAYPQAAADGQLSFRFGSVVSISIPNTWHYVQPTPPDRTERTFGTIKIPFVPASPVVADGYRLLEAQDTPLGTEPTHRLSLTFSGRKRHERSVLEAEFVAPTIRGANGIFDSRHNLPNSLRPLKFVSDLKILEAKIVQRGTLFCESYAVQYLINAQPHEAHNLVCPAQLGTIRLMLESTAPMAGSRSPTLSNIAAIVSE